MDTSNLTCPWCFLGRVNICREIWMYHETKFWWSCPYSDCGATGPKKNSEQDAILSLASFNKSFQLPNFYRLISKNDFGHQIQELKNVTPYFVVPFLELTDRTKPIDFVSSLPTPMKTKTFINTGNQLVRLFDYVEKD